MKIIAINRKHSTDDWVACRTDAHLTPEIARQFLAYYEQRIESDAARVKVSGPFVLIQRTKWPVGFTEFVSQVLTRAQGLVAHDQDIERERQNLSATQNDDMLEAIAKSQNLPIE